MSRCTSLSLGHSGSGYVWFDHDIAKNSLVRRSLRGACDWPGRGRAQVTRTCYGESSRVYFVLRLRRTVMCSGLRQSASRYILILTSFARIHYVPRHFPAFVRTRPFSSFDDHLVLGSDAVGQAPGLSRRARSADSALASCELRDSAAYCRAWCIPSGLLICCSRAQPSEILRL